MLQYDAKSKIFETNTYRLEFTQDHYFVLLKNKRGNTLTQLFLYSSIHSIHGLDDTTVVGEWDVDVRDTEGLLSCVCSSTIWQQKRYWLRCLEDRFYYGIEVEGIGSLLNISYFSGYCSALDRWGSGFFTSGQGFQQGWTPEPNTRERIYFSPNSSEGIDLNGVPVPGRDGWFFTPPPYCFAFEKDSQWLGLGVACKPGENKFVDYHYRGGDESFNLELSYEGYTLVDGHYRLPEIGFYFAGEPYSVLTNYVTDVKERGLVPSTDTTQRHDWWREPIYCGWGSQCYLASLENGYAPQYATQTNYERFMRELAERNIFPGTIVIDDKWQAAYGLNSVDLTKWPDMPGFIRRRHECGQKVLLWLKFWDPEGLPASECIRNSIGKCMSVDPTSPSFQQRMREQVRYMLSPQGLNADGFKIDFSARIPSGPGMKVFGDLWGLELMRLYFSIVHSESKSTKPDALIIAHAPNPYLSPYIDMVRLNDINVGKDLATAMQHRQKVARIALPEALIDTDNWQIKDKAEWLTYIKLQPQLGVPALYYNSHIDRTGEIITDEDIHTLNEVWDRYRSKTS